MLEDECHKLDVKPAADMAIKRNQIKAGDFDSYVKERMTIHDLKYSIARIDEKIDMVNEATISQVMFPEKEKEIYDIYQERLHILSKQRNLI